LAVKIISDVHGEYAALRDQLAPDDIAVLLGDYLNLIDFRTLDGILAEVYSKEEVVRALALIASGDKEQVRQQIRATIGGAAEKNEMVRERIAQSYEEFFASIPCKCFMLYGNTDGPEVMRAFVRGNTELIESGVVEIDGEKFGMVSGAPLGPWNIGLPGEMETDRYNALIASRGPRADLGHSRQQGRGGQRRDTVFHRGVFARVPLLRARPQPEGVVYGPRQDAHGQCRLLQAAQDRPDPPLQSLMSSAPCTSRTTGNGMAVTKSYAAIDGGPVAGSLSQ
jgi:predicted phosphodiesterase